MSAEGFEVAEAYLSVKADDAGLRDKVTAAVQAASEGQDIQVKLGVDGDALRQRIDAAVGAASGEDVKVGLDVDSGLLREKVDAAVHGLGDELGPEADRVGSRLGEDLGNGLFRDLNGKIRNSSGQFASEAEKLAAGLDPIKTKADGAGTSLDDLGRKASGAGNAASSAGGGFNAGAAGIGSMVVAALALAPALAAIPALVTGAAFGLGTLKLGLDDVTKALKDHAAQSTATGQSQASMAASAFSNAVSIRNAEQTIADARRQSAIGAQNSAAAVTAAQQALMDAERAAGVAAQNSADQVTAAQQRVSQAAYSAQQAEQSYTNALYSEQQAQQALTRARQDAANQLADAQNSAADANLSAEQAANRLADAQTALTLAQNNGMTSPVQLRDALFAVKQAQQGVTDANQRAKEATEKANQATKDGVDGAPAVVSAQHAVQAAAEATAAAQHNVTVAAQGQADAQHALAVATRDAANQQIASAESVAKAQLALADAQRNADQQRAASAEQVTKAVQALKDMQEQQRLSAAAAASAGGASANQFSKDMAQLTPAGQAFVNQLLSMKQALDDLKNQAQTAMLPGFTQFLKDLPGIAGPVQDAVKNTGGALGDMAAQIGALFQDPKFQAAFGQFLGSATDGLKQFTSAIAPMIGKIVDVGVKAKPITDAVAKFVHELMTSGLPAFFEGLVSHAGNASQGIGALLGLLNNLLGPLGSLIGAISGALGPGIAALAGPLGTVIGQIASALTPAITALTPFITALGQGIGTLLTGAMAALLPSLKTFIGDFVQILDAVAPLIGPVAKLAAELMPMASMFLTLGATVLDALMPALLPLIDAVVKLGTWISDHLTPVVHDLNKVFGIVSDGIKTAIGDAIGFVKDHFNDVVMFVGGLGGRFLSGTVGLWDWLKVGFKDVINWLIDGFNFFIDKVNGVTGGLSDVWSWTGAPTIPTIHDIPKLAAGGILTSPGFVDVGDQDRERIFLPKGASVVPLPKPIQTVGNANSGKTAPTIHLHYYGPQAPTGEQKAIMYRELALAVHT